VLRDHPRFAWNAVVDPQPERLEQARTQWQIAHAVRTPDELRERDVVDVVVLATPPHPGARLEVLDAFPNLRAVFVEKPLGTDLRSGEEFVAACSARGIAVQVNLTRRGDRTVRGLAAGGLAAHIGRAQAASGIYGNGLVNNGTHMIDLVRWLLGEVESAISLADERSRFAQGPIGGDRNIPFALRLESGLSVAFTPVRFEHYREIALDVWGERGRFSYAHGGLDATVWRIAPSTVLSDCAEIESGPGQVLPVTLGEALYELYTNLADALDDGAALLSPAESALRTAAVVDAVIRSDDAGGSAVRCALAAVGTA
jgi:predicted dehydrogenase